MDRVADTTFNAPSTPSSPVPFPPSSTPSSAATSKKSYLDALLQKAEPVPSRIQKEEAGLQKGETVASLSLGAPLQWGFTVAMNWAAQPRLGGKIGFSIHGARQPAGVTNRSTQSKLAIETELGKEMMEKLRKIMPSLKRKKGVSHVDFWQRQWDEHGQHFKLPMKEYFQMIIDLFENLESKLEQARRRIDVSSPMTIASLLQHFEKIFHVKVQLKLKKCKDGHNYFLKEVIFAFDSKLRLKDVEGACVTGKDLRNLRPGTVIYFKNQA